MGLFNKKKTEPQPAAPQTVAKAVKPTAVNPDDIWGTPKPKAKPGVESAEPMTEQVSIDPETIKKKMEALERELEEQKNKPAQAYEPFGSVGDDEVVSAQAKYEEQYRIEHERYLASHKEDIDEAPIDSEIDRRINAIVEERDRRAEETKKVLKDIKMTDDELMAKGMQELGVAKDETKSPEYQNINAVDSAEVESKLSGLGVAKDETQSPEYQNISSVSSEESDAKTKEFLEKYGDRRKPDDISGNQ